VRESEREIVCECVKESERERRGLPGGTGTKWACSAARGPRKTAQKSPARQLTTSSHRMYQLNGFRKSPPPQNRQLVVHYY